MPAVPVRKIGIQMRSASGKIASCKNDATVRTESSLESHRFRNLHPNIGAALASELNKRLDTRKSRIEV